MIDHKFKKKFGQNFISDTNLLRAIVTDAGVNKDDEVLEIGAGAGTLTKELALSAKKVVSYEIDKDLQDILLSERPENVKYYFEDALAKKTSEIEKDFLEGYKVVANLPYYITTPLIFKFLEESDRVESITIMVQKEVAERLVAPVGGKVYGILTVMANFYGKAEIKRIVKRTLFFPQPNVDSAIVRIDIDREKYKEIDKQKFSSFVRGAFAMRRKTLSNNLSASLGLSKEKLKEFISESDIAKRAEGFDCETFVKFYKNIFQKKC